MTRLCVDQAPGRGSGSQPPGLRVTQVGRQTVRPSEVCFHIQKVVSGDGQPSAQTSTWNVAEASPRNAGQQSPKDEIRES